MRTPVSSIAALVVFLSSLGLLLWHAREAPDFTNIWSAAKLATSPDLYDHVALRHVAGDKSTCTFNRLPFAAVLYWPLGALPYLLALRTWQSLQLAGFLIAALLLTKRWWVALLSILCYLPVTQALVNGQDLGVLLAVLAIGYRLLEKHPLVAGLVWSLGAIKPHLLLLVPLAFVAGRQWRVLVGFLAGGASLAAISFAAQGADWPLRYLGVTRYTRSVTETHRDYIPTLYGFLQRLPEGLWLGVVTGFAIAILVWKLCRRLPLRTGIPAAVALSLMVAPHAYLYDLSILLFPALALLDAAPALSMRLLLSSLVSSLLLATFAWPTQLVLGAVIGWFGFEMWRNRGSASISTESRLVTTGVPIHS